MNIGGIHFCQDELFAILSALPVVGVVVARARAAWKRAVS